ncbi:MAG: polysaccharide deacetylase family protein, partial [Bacillota bacterium]|nr:polysaccharide deacetylase family protein [Bacillota bacterium]
MYVALLRLPRRAIVLSALVLAAGAGLPALGLRAFPALAPQLSAVQPPVRRVERPERAVALSFEAVWVDTQCNRILELLERRKVRATFFISGYWAERYPELVRRIAARGHELGNYTFSHPHLTSLSAEAIRSELEENARLLRGLTDLTPRLFRPPFGEYNALVMAVAKELGYQVVWYDVEAP